MFTRRGFLTRTAPLALAPWLAKCAVGKGRRTPTVPTAPTPIVAGTRFRFIHGVASGDPLSTAIILWTRVTPLTLISNSLSSMIEATWSSTSRTSGCAHSGTSFRPCASRFHPSAPAEP
jgi:phosphodiesterase/alkaline phosphatase D-like protein